MELFAAIGAFVLIFLVLRVLSSGRAASVDLDVPPTEDSVRRLLLEGRKIQAIKVYRELHRVDLKTAKEAVERLSFDAPAPS